MNLRAVVAIIGCLLIATPALPQALPILRPVRIGFMTRKIIVKPAGEPKAAILDFFDTHRNPAHSTSQP
jgi:hypothetical protein